MMGSYKENGFFSWGLFLVMSLLAGYYLSRVRGKVLKLLVPIQVLSIVISLFLVMYGLDRPSGLAKYFYGSNQMGYVYFFVGIASLFAFVKNGLFKRLVKITHRPDGVSTTDRPSVGNDGGKHNDTASRRRLRDVFDKSQDDKEDQGLWPWWKKALNVFVDLSSTTPTAGVELDQTDYLLEPSIVGGIPDKLSDKKGVFSGTLLGKALNITTQDRALIIGPPGTGKTAFLVAQLLIWAESKRSFICLDMKPEIWGITKEALIKQGYDVFAYNPTSGGGDRYNPLDDIDSPEAIGELTANLIEEQGADHAVFFETARDLLDAVINHLKSLGGSVSLPEVRDYISGFKASEMLLKDLRNSDDDMAREIACELSMVAENERLFASIIASLRTGLKFLRYPAIKQSLSASDFSLKQFKAPNRPIALFLQFEEGKAEMLQRLTAMMIGHIMRYMIDNTDREDVLLLLDEIGNAKGIKGLASKLNTIRSRKLPTWLYWQSSTQMNVYSEDNAQGKELIFGACDFVGVFRLNDNETAKYISEKIGTIHRLMTSHSASYTTSSSSGSGSGSGSYEGGPSASSSSSSSHGMNNQKTKQLQEEAVIKPHELQELPDGQMVCMYRGESWKGEATPYYKARPEYNGVKPTAVRPSKKVGDVLNTTVRPSSGKLGIAKTIPETFKPVVKTGPSYNRADVLDLCDKSGSMPEALIELSETGEQFDIEDLFAEPGDDK
ncbi:MAG: type IV secretory system conjugative DNA transfer family protein [Alteromonadaceae bacterium]|nr:type IV secretory system conjugative DNA transfer family protein [Alteromonadaceae bacterium]